jgi:hypothetical protein
MRMPLLNRDLSALVHRGVDVRDADGRLHLVEPNVMVDTRLRWPCESDDRGGQSAGDDGGESKLIHAALLLNCVPVRNSFRAGLIV